MLTFPSFFVSEGTWGLDVLFSPLASYLEDSWRNACVELKIQKNGLLGFITVFLYSKVR